MSESEAHPEVVPQGSRMSGWSGRMVRTAVREVDLETISEGLSRLEGYEQVLVVYRRRGCVVGRSFLKIRDGKVDPQLLREPLSGFAWEVWLQMIDDYDRREPRPRTASVIVCTRNRTADLARCLPRLLPLLEQGHEILVVDSCPSTDETAALVGSFPGIRYLREAFPGAALARNRGIAAAKREFIAFTDDDAQVDAHWLDALLRNFDDELVAVVTGITMPIELETDAQLWFERTNTFSRGFLRTEFDLSNFEPLIAGLAGCSVNMAVRAAALERIGAFDPTLGPGSRGKCGEDHELYARALRSGYRIVYDPAALAWHRHRREWKDLRHVVYTYGVGVFAWWTRALFCDGELGVLKVASSWFLRHHAANLARALLRRNGTVPLDLAWAEFAGAVEGPFAYFRSRRDARRKGITDVAPPLARLADDRAA